MLDPVSVALKFAFLGVLYLFLLWMARSVMTDLRRASSGSRAAGSTPTGPPADATGLHAASGPPMGADGALPRLVVDSVVGVASGMEYDLYDEATLGRGDVEVKLEDPFASGRHAQISRSGSTLVIEDLGSTNGTYLNEELLQGPAPLHAGDRIRIGDSTFIFQT